MERETAKRIIKLLRDILQRTTDQDERAALNAAMIAVDQRVHQREMGKRCVLDN